MILHTYGLTSGFFIHIVEEKNDVARNDIVIPLSFWQQIVEHLFKFEISTSAPGFLILNLLASNGYKK